jgi:hypothetical protein
MNQAIPVFATIYGGLFFSFWYAFQAPNRTTPGAHFSEIPFENKEVNLCSRIAAKARDTPFHSRYASDGKKKAPAK